FSRKNQRHACGTGNRADVLRDKPPAVIEVYRAIENIVTQLGDVEIVARDRYVLFRSRRIFTDLSIMKDAVRLAIHLGRKVDNPLFIKVVDDGKQVTHVVKIASAADVSQLIPLLKEAYTFSLE
ncbi:MAG: hypothetical protein KKE30_17845, partial [Gammaproteobacteria bacterium]|nr:hypothetical protein [Gammaproteobacteria bacterium]MBU1557248.1 hypothetical protein [Gammaproteobacteria bacterium]